MTRSIKTFAPLFAIAAAAVALPAAAQPAVSAATTVAVPPSRICVENLTSARCGRYQERILIAAAQHAGKRTDAASVRELGRSQLNALLESFG